MVPPPVINSVEPKRSRPGSWLVNTPADWDPQKVGGSIPPGVPNTPPRSSIRLCSPFSKLKVIYSLVLIVLIVFGSLQGK